LARNFQYNTVIGLSLKIRFQGGFFNMMLQQFLAQPPLLALRMGTYRYFP
jgi:hypothetical protein